jgi:hydrogenase small subunit
MSAAKGTLWAIMKEKGYSRRDFLQFCTYAATAAGLAPNASGAVAKVFEKKARPPVVWLHFQECTCCSESFIRSSHPIVSDVLLDYLSLDYTETLQAEIGRAHV